MFRPLPMTLQWSSGLPLLLNSNFFGVCLVFSSLLLESNAELVLAADWCPYDACVQTILVDFFLECLLTCPFQFFFVPLHLLPCLSRWFPIFFLAICGVLPRVFFFFFFLYFSFLLHISMLKAPMNHTTWLLPSHLNICSSRYLSASQRLYSPFPVSFWFPCHSCCRL